MEIPSPEDFFLETSLYLDFPVSKYNYKKVLRVEYFRGTIDSFCVGCGQSSVFSRQIELPRIGLGVQSYSPKDIEEFLESYSAWFPSKDNPYGALSSQTPEEYAISERNIIVEFGCTRNSSHHLFFIFRVQGNSIVKIGQYPSLADLQGDEIKKYRKILSNERYLELKRAIGLNSHGIGIGAFIYLRRIIEDLIDKAHAKAKETPGWDEEKYSQSRVTERIKLLENRLPNFLVENQSAYSILSKGIHSLEEQECLVHFGSLKLAIELILDEELERKEREGKIAKVSEELGKIKGQLQ